MEIKVQKLVVDDWKPFDFVNYFYGLRGDAYGVDKLIKGDTVHGECMRMQRLMSLFDLYNKSKEDLQTFIRWGIEYYQKETKYAVPPEVGFLTAIVRTYLGLPPKTKTKKKKREKVVLSPEAQAWIKEMKKEEASAKRRAK